MRALLWEFPWPSIFSFSEGRAHMPGSIQVRIHLVMDVLALIEPSSLNPRRNTSKTFFEPFRGGNEAATCILFVAAPFPLCFHFLLLPATKRKHVSTSKSPILHEYEGYDD
jgi:hypothetical protein